MAAKWWRYNSTSHIFEQSLDEGTSWTPPPLNASIITEGVFDPARLGGSLAFTNVTNVFTATQDFTGNVGTNYDGAPIEIRTTNNPRIGFHWAGVIASQLGMDSSGVIRTYDNPGTGFAAFSAAGIVANGGITSTGNIMCGTNFHNTGGYVYPGNISGGGSYQGSWYLSGHSSYGLYTNTGIYVENYVWALAVEGRAHIRAAGGLYDYARATPLGDWTAWSLSGGNFWAASGTWTVTSQDYNYCYIGHTCHVIFNVHASALTAATGALYIHTPVTSVGRHQNCGFAYYIGTSVNTSGTLAIDVGASSNYLQLINREYGHGASGVISANTSLRVYGHACFQFA